MTEKKVIDYMAMQLDLTKKINEIVVSRDYPISIILSVFEMLKLEYGMQSFLNHFQKKSQDKLELIKNGMDKDMINKIKGSAN